MSESTLQSFWNAVAENDVAACELLLNNDPSLVSARYFGIAWTPEPNPSIHFSNTALHTASVNSRVDVAKLLIRFGADVNAIGYEDNKGLTPPIVLAAWEGSTEMLQCLLDAGADPNLAASAETALYCAAEHGASEKVDTLLISGARYDVFTAAILGEVEILKQFLTAYRPLLNARSLKRNRTVREEAEHHQQAAIVKLLDILE
jgi:hypothetical protein